MRSNQFLFFYAAFVALPSNAQTGAPANQLSHDEVIARVTGLMYVRGMARKCPFPKNVADTFEIVAMAVASSMPRISPEEAAAAAKNAEAGVDRHIAVSKEESCRKAQQTVEAVAGEMAKAQKR